MRNNSQNTEVLIDLIDKIKKIKKINQGKISLLAGYDTETYLSEAKSTGNVSDNIIKAVRNVYEKALADPSFLDGGIEKIEIKNVPALTIENQIEIIASVRVIISILAEIQAALPEAKLLPTQLLNIYQKMVRDEAKQFFDELKQ